MAYLVPQLILLHQHHSIECSIFNYAPNLGIVVSANILILRMCDCYQTQHLLGAYL